MTSKCIGEWQANDTILQDCGQDENSIAGGDFGRSPKSSDAHVPHTHIRKMAKRVHFYPTS